MKRILTLISCVALAHGVSAQVTDTGGNVGIGNAAPAHKLDVNGDINISSGNVLRMNGAQVMSTEGLKNMFIGEGTGANLSAGSYNAAIGFKAGEYVNNGQFNTLIGFKAGQNMTNSNSNTIIGKEAGKNNTGNQNVLIGREAGINAAGSENTVIGDKAGQGITTGSSNTLIGKNANVASGSLTNATAIGAGAVAASSNSVILGNGASVGIGTSSPSYDLDVAGDVNFTGDLYKNGVLMGAAGPTGATGPAGPQGATGPAGANGAVGPTGPLVNGTTNQTIYHNGSNWVAGSNLKNNGNTVNIGDANISSTTRKLHVSDNFNVVTGTTNLVQIELDGTSEASVTALNVKNDCAGGGNKFGIYNQLNGSTGSQTGVYHFMTGTTTTSKTGGHAYVYNSSATSYGFRGRAGGTGNNFGIHGEASNGNINWAGYFVGSTYSTGTYQGSDIKLKRNVKEIGSAMELVSKLNPTTYEFKTDEFEKLRLEEGQRFGFIAHELKEVLPQFVKANKQEVYSEPDKNGLQELVKTIEFDVVNYTEFIPILTKAIQEQQDEIESLKAVQAENLALKDRLDRMEEMMSRFGTDLQECCLASNSDQLEIKQENGGDQDQTEIDDQPMLEQNTPNPFRENTVIKYYLPDGATSAELQISDLNGSIIQSFSLVNKGLGQVLITGGSLKAGTYFYSLVINGHRIDSKRMMLF